MKAEVIETGFHPVEITITVESKEEVRYLWHLFNASMGNVEELFNKSMSSHKVPPPNMKMIHTNMYMPLFDAIDEVARDTGVREDLGD